MAPLSRPLTPGRKADVSSAAQAAPGRLRPSPPGSHLAPWGPTQRPLHCPQGQDSAVSGSSEAGQGGTQLWALRRSVGGGPPAGPGDAEQGPAGPWLPPQLERREKHPPGWRGREQQPKDRGRGWE